MSGLRAGGANSGEALLRAVLLVDACPDGTAPGKALITGGMSVSGCVLATMLSGSMHVGGALPDMPKRFETGRGFLPG